MAKKKNNVDELEKYRTSIDVRNEICWETGIYDEYCDCNSCPHNSECSGYDKDNDNDDWED